MSLTGGSHPTQPIPRPPPSSPSDPSLSGPANVRFDWYEATIHGSDIAEVRGEFDHALPDIEAVPGVGRSAYTNRWTYTRDERVCDVLYGGNPGIHVTASGASSEAVAAILRRSFPDHLPTRVDAALDMVGVGLFDKLAEVMQAFAVERRITLRHDGDWTRGQTRTLYLGSRRSPVYLRLYEKGGKEGGDPNWIRLEVEVKAKRHARAAVARKAAHELFGSSRWLADLCELIGFDALGRFSIGSRRVPTNAERALIALFRQYGPILDRLREESPTDEAFLAVIDQASAVRASVIGTPPNLYHHAFVREAQRRGLFSPVE